MSGRILLGAFHERMPLEGIAGESSLGWNSQDISLGTISKEISLGESSWGFFLEVSKKQCT